MLTLYTCSAILFIYEIQTPIHDYQSQGLGFMVINLVINLILALGILTFTQFNLTKSGPDPLAGIKAYHDTVAKVN